MSILSGTRRPFRKSVFFRILISLMSLTLIPIFFLGLTSYFVFYKSVASHTEEYDRLILSTMSEKIDRDLDEVREIMFRYALFLDIVQDDYGVTLEIIRELGGIAGTNDLIADIFIFYLDTDQVLTQQGIYYRETFFNKVYKYGDSAAEAFHSYLHEKNNFRVLGTSLLIQDGFIENHYVTILNSLPLGLPPKANMVTLIDEAFLESIIESIVFDGKDSNICIINSNLKPITGTIDEHLDKERLRANLLEQKNARQSGIYSFRIGNTAVFGTRSDVTDWHYLVFSPAKQISSKAASIRYITIWICAVLILICFLLAWAISMNLYTPIRDIVNTISNGSLKKQKPNPKTDELGYILEHMRYVTDRNKSLDSNAKLTEPAFRDHYLRSLILGIPNKIIGSSEVGYKLQWPYGKFSVLVVETSTDRKIVPSNYPGDTIAADFLRYLEEAINAGEGRFGVLTHIGKSRITILLNLQSEKFLDEWLIEIEPELERYAEKCQCAITFGVGGLCHAVSQINESYEEAIRVLQNRKIHAKVQILRFTRTALFSNLTTSAHYTVEKERQLTYEVLSGDYGKVEQTLNGIIADNVIGDATYDQLIVLFKRLMDTTSQILEKNNRLKQKLENTDLFASYQNGNPNNVDELRKRVLKVYEDLTLAALKTRRDQSNELKERLVSYIEENFDDPEISLERIADEFDLNAKYISRYFKENTGTKYLNYLNTARINRAKEILVTQKDMKILEISRGVGFYNVNTFISVFKKKEGVTPSAFRKLSTE
jgi:two-component system, response regulator YesN